MYQACADKHDKMINISVISHVKDHDSCEREENMYLETWLRIGTYTYYSNSERKSTARKRGGHTYPCEFTHSQQQTFINAISIYFVSFVTHNANKGQRKWGLWALNKNKHLNPGLNHRKLTMLRHIRHCSWPSSHHYWRGANRTVVSLQLSNQQITRK